MTRHTGDINPSGVRRFFRIFTPRQIRQIIEALQTLARGGRRKLTKSQKKR